jgi:hypothetical protein
MDGYAGGRVRRETLEPRYFMYSKYLNHPGLATIQYKTFFHMCRLEVSFTFLSFSQFPLILNEEQVQPSF